MADVAEIKTKQRKRRALRRRRAAAAGAVLIHRVRGAAASRLLEVAIQAAIAANREAVKELEKY